jgi:hypothetical protein
MSLWVRAWCHDLCVVARALPGMVAHGLTRTGAAERRDAAGHVPGRSAELAGELIVHRPPTWSPGVARRIRIYLDGRRVADLAYGATVRICAYDGRHQLRARCRPLSTAELIIDLAPCQTLRLVIYVGTLGDLRIWPAPTVQRS